MALYTGAAIFRLPHDEAPRLTGSGVQLTHSAAATLLEGRLIADIDPHMVDGPITASITEDNPNGSAVLFSAEGTFQEVLDALTKHRAGLDS